MSLAGTELDDAHKTKLQVWINYMIPDSRGMRGRCQGWACW